MNVPSLHFPPWWEKHVLMLEARKEYRKNRNHLQINCTMSDNHNCNIISSEFTSLDIKECTYLQ